MWLISKIRNRFTRDEKFEKSVLSNIEHLSEAARLMYNDIERLKGELAATKASIRKIENKGKKKAK